MKVQFIAIEDAIEQNIFDVYAHIELCTEFNSFQNH